MSFRCHKSFIFHNRERFSDLIKHWKRFWMKSKNHFNKKSNLACSNEWSEQWKIYYLFALFSFNTLFAFFIPGVQGWHINYITFICFPKSFFSQQFGSIKAQKFSPQQSRVIQLRHSPLVFIKSSEKKCLRWINKLGFMAFYSSGIIELSIVVWTSRQICWCARQKILTL